MEKSDEILIERHIHEDEELQRSVGEHRQLKVDLEGFKNRLHLTPEEEVEKKVLQKKKLLGKERIFAILEKYRRA